MDNADCKKQREVHWRTLENIFVWKVPQTSTCKKIGVIEVYASQTNAKIVCICLNVFGFLPVKYSLNKTRESSRWRQPSRDPR